MKKSLFILLSLTIFACSNKRVEDNISFDDIKYFTKNSVKVGTLLKEELKIKDVILLNYPEYVSESYDVIKYISAIMDINSKINEGLIVVYPGLPKSEENRQFLDIVTEQSPLLGFKEFIDLYDFLDSNNITFTDEIPLNSKKLLILAPDSKYEEIKKTTYEKLSPESIVNIVIAGSKYTMKLHNIIKELPISKKTSSIALSDNEFNIMIMAGEVTSYTPINPIELYTIENYTTAPEFYLEENKSVFETIQIEKMNKNLPKLIKNSFKIIGE